MLFTYLFFMAIAATYSLTINDKKPIIREIALPKIINLKQERLNCDLDQGIQPLTFEWYHNNKKLENNNKTIIKIRDDSAVLIIKSLSIDDLGDYKCVVRNSYGEHSQKVPFYINFKPNWIKEPKDVITSLLNEVNLECHAKGYPFLINKWIKLADDKKTTLKEFQQSNTIKFQLTKETSGYYKCISSNPMGSIEKIINVGYYGK